MDPHRTSLIDVIARVDSLEAANAELSRVASEQAQLLDKVTEMASRADALVRDLLNQLSATPKGDTK